MPFSMNFIFQVFIRAIVVFTALPFHEYAHGFVAKKLGDYTATSQGRLTLNPLAHFDIIGTTCLLLTGFGWAKPVPVNPRNFKNPKAGMALTSLAGPVANIILATVLMIIYKIIFFFLPSTTFLSVLGTVISTMISINVGLAVFNLLPVPPLDGAKIFGAFLPNRIYFSIMKYEQQIMMVFFIILFGNNFLYNATGIDLLFPLNYISRFLYTGIDFITKFIDLIARAVL